MIRWAPLLASRAVGTTAQTPFGHGSSAVMGSGMIKQCLSLAASKGRPICLGRNGTRSFAAPNSTAAVFRCWYVHAIRPIKGRIISKPLVVGSLCRNRIWFHLNRQFCNIGVGNGQGQFYQRFSRGKRFFMEMGIFSLSSLLATGVMILSFGTHTNTDEVVTSLKRSKTANERSPHTIN